MRQRQRGTTMVTKIGDVSIRHCYFYYYKWSVISAEMKTRRQEDMKAKSKLQ